MADPTALPLRRGDDLTRVVKNDGVARNRPEDHDNGYLSVMAGKLNAAQALALMGPHTLPLPGGVDGASHTTVGRLLDAGFVVSSRPYVKNRLHVAVHFSGEWVDESVDAAFAGCFDEPEWWSADG